MKLRRLVSGMLALLLACSLPLTAFAEDWYLEDGDIIVNATESGQTVSQGAKVDVPDSAPVITQYDSSTYTTNTVFIQVEENTTANVTLDGVNIDTSSIYQAAIYIMGDGNVTIELDGTNTVQSGGPTAGVSKHNGGNLTITNSDEVTADNPGSLKAIGGGKGAGIGGGQDRDGNNITISGNAQVEAQGGENGAGIGGGVWRDGSNITIEDNAVVSAIGGELAAGIGGGHGGSGSNITITGSAKVTAKGGDSGAGIGGSFHYDGSNITISGNAQVKAQGGESPTTYNKACGTGAAIGDGGDYQLSPGKEAEVNAADLDEGWIAKYAPGTGMDTTAPTSVTYRDNNTLQTVTENITLVEAEPATCTEDGNESGFEVNDKRFAAAAIPATGHNVPNGYTPQNDATCTELGTMKGYCTNCKSDISITDPNSTLKDHTFTTYTPDPGNLATCTKAGTKTAVCDDCGEATQTVTDPAKGHSFTNYISNNDATYEADGTKTAKCDHCDATDTIPAPGSKLVPEETPQTAPLYRVIGQDGKGLACKEARSSGVLTITVDADFATLTGSVSGLKTLKAQGVDTIVFVTNGATSTFALSDLLAQGSDTYALTHDGKTVTFTLGSGADIGKILK